MGPVGVSSGTQWDGEGGMGLVDMVMRRREMGRVCCGEVGFICILFIAAGFFLWKVSIS